MVKIDDTDLADGGVCVQWRLINLNELGASSGLNGTEGLCCFLVFLWRDLDVGYQEGILKASNKSRFCCVCIFLRVIWLGHLLSVLSLISLGC